MTKRILLFFFLFTQIIFCQEDSRFAKNRLIKEAQEQLNKGIDPRDVVLVNKSQTMAEADEIEEIKVQLKEIEKARALKLKQIAEAKEDSIAEATNPILREIRDKARAEKAKEDLEEKERRENNAKEYYFDGYTPLDTLISRQLKMGILPCDVKVTCYADFYSIQGAPDTVKEALMINEKLLALCRGLKVGQDVPKYVIEIENYAKELLKNHFDNESTTLYLIQKGSYYEYPEKIQQIQKLDSLYKLRPVIFSKSVNLISRLTRDYKAREMADISLLLIEAKKDDINERFNNNKLSQSDYEGIIKMNWDEGKYFASKTKKNISPKTLPVIKYQSIWSSYSEKKLTKMPHYNIEEAESYSTFTYDNNTKTFKIETSSPDGEEVTTIKIDTINNEVNKINYTGKNNLSKIIISVNKLTKWIEITNITNGTLSFEYHKIN